ncbi:hypothetical protein Q3G72_023169 [Acer saccharum]|nr:hypothetical protein Q3G72_023169 [Acer saccharum]
MALWHTWFRRNNCVNNLSEVCANDIRPWVESYLVDFREANAVGKEVLVLSVPVDLMWKSPEDDEKAILVSYGGCRCSSVDRDLIGLPLLPTSEASFRGADVDSGVNYASAAAGILDESGKLLGERFNLRQQVENFRSTVGQLKKQMDETKMEEYLAKSLIVMNLGSNDYINNYLIPSFYNSSFNYNPIQYALLLITQYTTNIMELHNLGARKFLLAAIGPLGCMPNQLATGLAPPGKCVSFVNDMVEEFNKGLLSLVHQLNTNHTTSTFVFLNTYAAFTDILNNPVFHGFSVTDRGCCGIGRNRGQITCLPFSIPCLNRDEYIFWDAYHPTQAFNQIIAEKAFNGGLSVCYPMNVKQMAQV